MSRLHPLLVFGTRPEAIKMAPVVHECERRPDSVQPIICVTGQHREMLDHVIDWFEIRVDEHLDLMTPNQTLSGLSVLRGTIMYEISALPAGVGGGVICATRSGRR